MNRPGLHSLPITVNDHVVRIGHATDGPFGVAVVVTGGTLGYDVSHASPFPSATITDPQAASDWLDGVYGDGAADAVHRAATGALTAITPLHDRLTNPVRRLGLGLWLHRWWPAGSDTIPGVAGWLLEAEIAAVAWQAEACLPDGDVVPTLLEPHAKTLYHTIVGLRRFGSGDSDRRSLTVLTAILRTVVEALDDDTAGYIECTELLDRIEAEEITTPTVSSPASDDLVRSLSLAEGQLIMSAPPTNPLTQTSEPRLQGVTTADRRVIAPRTVAAHQGNVRWAVTDNSAGASRIRVTADAATSVPPLAPLMARVYAGSSNPTCFELDLDRTSGTLIGVGDLSGQPRSVLGVDVFTAGMAGKARISAEALAAARAEEATRDDFIRARSAASDLFLAEEAAWNRMRRP